MTAYVTSVPGGPADSARSAAAKPSSADARVAEMRGRTRRTRKERRTAKAEAAKQTAGASGTAGRGGPSGGAAMRSGVRADGTEHSPSLPDPPAARPRPRADCTADSAGGLTFDIRLGDAAQGQEPRGDAALVLRLRGGTDPSGTVRLPLGPAEPDGAAPGFAGQIPMRAVLPSTMSLQEGRWDAYLAVEGEEPRRVLPGVHDLRSLVDRVPREGRTWLGVRIPYATKFGNLTVRSWLRWPHAEAGALCVGDGGLVLRGMLYGARLSRTATLEAYPRGAGAVPVSVPLLREDDEREDESENEGAEGSGLVHATHVHATHDHAMRAHGTHGGEKHVSPGPPPRRFTARLPLGALPPGSRVWNLWVRPAAGEKRVRLARILDDVPDKKRIFSYPPQRVESPDGAVSTVTPYYTLDNDLSVRVSWAETTTSRSE